MIATTHPGPQWPLADCLVLSPFYSDASLMIMPMAGQAFLKA